MDIKKNNINNTQQIIKILEKILKEEYSDLDNEINNFRINTIDTSKSIQFIPNNLLCILAEEIIRLTAIKQKILLKMNM